MADNEHDARRLHMRTIALLSLLLVGATPSGAPPAEELTTHEQKGETATTEAYQSSPPAPPPVLSTGAQPSSKTGTHETYNYYCNAQGTKWTLATFVELGAAVAVAIFWTYPGFVDG